MPDIVEPNDVVTRAKDNFKRDQTHWNPIYDKAREDLFFLSDDPFAQWDPQDYKARVDTGRPALTIDQLGQFVHQVSNDIRQNTPTINVIPAGGDASKETAEIFKGLIRNIEYVSSADEAYDNASSFSVRSSIGFFRIDHDYCDDESNLQELKIKVVKNPFACMIDSNSVESDGADAKHGYVVDKIRIADFKKQYPDKDISCFETDQLKDVKDEDYITLCEYFEIEEKESMLAWDAMGFPIEYAEGQEYSATRKRITRTVKRYKLSGTQVLEETTFPGKYIPIVPVYGEEAWVDGKRNLFSLIRKSKQAQQMYNYWKSLETELLMKQPQAPIMAAEGQIEDYAEDWINPSKSAVLRYKQKDAEGNPASAPQRLEPPTIPTGIVNASRATVEDIKSTMGLYNASIGQRSNETSGIAIARRQQEGDVATFHFSDNLNRSVAHGGRILASAIPEIYDTARIIQIIDEEQEPKEVGVNGAAVEGQELGHDLTRGKYDIRIVAGPSYTTRRQESFQLYSDAIKAVPELSMIIGDLMFKYSDASGSEAVADRLKTFIEMKNPNLIKDDKPGAEDPKSMALQQALQQSQQIIGQLQQEMQQLQQQLDSKQGDLQIKAQSEAQKAEADQAQNQIDMIKMRIDEESKKVDAQVKLAELQLRARELDIQEQKLAADIALRNKELEIQQYNNEQQRIDNSVAQSMQMEQEIMGQP